MRSASFFGLFTAIAVLGATPARGEGLEGRGGPYVGIGLGASNLDVDPGSYGSRDADNGVLKLYGGYQFTEHFGIEGGYVRTGHVEETHSVDGVDVVGTAKTRAAYVVATGVLPVTDAFSVTGRLGAAFGDVNDGDLPPAPNSVYGSEVSLMAGVGVQYRLSERLSLALDYDHIGKESKRVSAETYSLTISRRF